MGNASSAHAAAVASDEVLHALAAAALDIIHRSTTSPCPDASVVAAHAPASSSSARCNVSGSSSSGSSAAGSASAGGFFVEGLSPRVQQLRTDLLTFMEQYVYPSESAFEEHAAGTNRWTVLPLMEELKAKVRGAAGIVCGRCTADEAGCLEIDITAADAYACDEKIGLQSRATYPPDAAYLSPWSITAQAKAQGLWNLWLPASLAAKVSHLVQHCHDPLDRQVLLGPGLNNLEYAHLCEITGRLVPHRQQGLSNAQGHRFGDLLHRPCSHHADKIFPIFAAGRPGPPRCSTVEHPTRATWKCWPSTEPRSSR